MNQSKQDIALGKFLSLILRHHPDSIGIKLDENGWADVGELLRGMKRAGHSIDNDTLERIVKENEKKRYSFNEDHTKIRANQGHSLKINMEFTPKEPPELLFHGTASRFLADIRKKGITKQSRQYVHLSADEKTAVSVGIRHGVPVVLKIDTKRMGKDGCVFYLSENGVWLCDYVAVKYILNLDNKDQKS